VRRKGPKSSHEGARRILVCAPSNRAVDQILERVLELCCTNIRHYITRVYARSIESGDGSMYKSSFDRDVRDRYDVPTALKEMSLHHKTRCSPDVNRSTTNCAQPRRTGRFSASTTSNIAAPRRRSSLIAGSS
jgi:hypothetical protein